MAQGKGVWQGGFKNYKKKIFKISKNHHNTKSINLEKNIFRKGVWPGGGGVAEGVW